MLLSHDPFRFEQVMSDRGSGRARRVPNFIAVGCSRVDTTPFVIAKEQFDRLLTRRDKEHLRG